MRQTSGYFIYEFLLFLRSTFMFSLTHLLIGQNNYKDCFKEWVIEKISSPEDLEFLSILKESLDESKQKNEEAV